MGKHTRLWHGAQSHELRSVNDTVEWELKQLKDGEIWSHLVDTAAVLRSGEELRHCGFDLDMPSHSIPSPDHPAIIRENDFADVLGRLILNMLGARLRRLLPLLRGWPRQQVRMGTFSGVIWQSRPTPSLKTRNFKYFIVTETTPEGKIPPRKPQLGWESFPP